MVELHDPMSEIRAGFFAECAERIEQLHDALAALEESCSNGRTADPEIINTAFRAIHSIKGGGGAFGFDNLVRFAHGVESVFDLMRCGQVAPSSALIANLTRAGDHLADLVDAAQAGKEVPANGSEILEALSTPTSIGVSDPMEFGLTQPWILQFRPHTSLYASGNDALFQLVALRELGAADICCDTSMVPDLAALDPEKACLTWTLSLPADRDEAEIVEIFDFVVDLCDLLVQRKELSSATVQNTVPSVSAETAPSMRVDLDRIDRLMNLVGELAISQSILVQCIAETRPDPQSHLIERLETLTGLTRNLQDSVMTIRAQPVKSLFQRMARVVRETSAALGKPARLRLEGEETELDRTVIERLADPLMHMVRNAVDHGLESPAERKTQQKPAEGTITLSAAHRAGRLVIELSDDGRGLDRNRIRAKAEERGLVTADAVLGDALTNDLIFHPGLSTAMGLSDISGRGVGMDVVKTAITRLGGRISIVSEPGRGTRFTLSLPLTLAVMDGMVVRTARQMLVIPVAAILETAALQRLDRRKAGDEGELVRMRDAFVSLIDTGVALGIRNPGCPPGSAIAVLIAAEDGRRAALIVDAVIDQRQVVVKPLRGGFARNPGISAATILGDGQIAFICDPGELARSVPTGRADLTAVA
ncbi:chemotaxis protein CheA [Defluviimonas aestuarii]|uniref:chemotaxis protein CheA n=1 Tax=Albidovulum aestuarii TaxID=1130726 RepID=UPI00249B4487|nr:chemotaxis protein CheA [Defluviimonas aestuarii]MDI3335185.1 chemotaxis protein CheA [Defluviimonas aestuarii]